MIRNVKKLTASVVLLGSALCIGGLLTSADVSKSGQVLDEINAEIANSNGQVVIHIPEDISLRGESITIPAGKKVVIDGQNHVIDGANSSGVILNQGELTLLNVTLQNGKPTPKAMDGGGIYNDRSATLTCKNVNIINSVGYNAGGIYNDGKLTLKDSLVKGNSAIQSGGGLYSARSSDTIIDNTQFIENVSAITGGAISAKGTASLTISGGSLFQKNVSSAGAAIYATLNTVLNVSNSVFEKNVAGTYGGGIALDEGRTYDGIDFSTLSFKHNLARISEEQIASHNVTDEAIVKYEALGYDQDKDKITNVTKFTFHDGIKGQIVWYAYRLEGRAEEPIGLDAILKQSKLTWCTADKTPIASLEDYLKLQKNDEVFYSNNVILPDTPTPSPDPNPTPGNGGETDKPGGNTGGGTVTPTLPGTGSTTKPTGTLPSTGAKKPAAVVVAKKITISGKKIVRVKKTIKLRAKVTPANTKNKKVTWSSSNKKIATVDKNGKVKAKKAGVVIITAKTANKKTATFRVTVTDKHTKKKTIKVKKGQSLVKIAKKLKIKDWRNLLSWNDKIKTPNRLPKAQKLVYYVFK